MNLLHAAIAAVFTVSLTILLVCLIGLYFAWRV